MLYAPMQGVNRASTLTLPSNRVDKTSERCYILASNRAWLGATLIGDVDGLTYVYAAGTQTLHGATLHATVEAADQWQSSIPSHQTSYA